MHKDTLLARIKPSFILPYLLIEATPLILTFWVILLGIIFYGSAGVQQLSSLEAEEITFSTLFTVIIGVLRPWLIPSFIITAILTLLLLKLSFSAQEYTLYEGRIEWNYAFFVKKRRVFPREKITAVTLLQGILAQLFKTGFITLQVEGVEKKSKSTYSGKTFTLRFIREPERVYELVRRLLGYTSGGEEFKTKLVIPSFLISLLISWAGMVFLILLIIIGATERLDFFFTHIREIILITVILTLFYGILSAARLIHTTYTLGRGGVQISTVFLGRREVFIPYNRIADVRVQQDPFERSAGTARLTLTLRGGGEAFITLPFVKNGILFYEKLKSSVSTAKRESEVI